jgi:hypothetical protein
MKFIPLRAVTLSVLFLASACVSAAQPGRLNVTVKSPDAALKDHTFMVSAIGNGAIVRQYEVLLNPRGDANTILDSLPPGSYDVRLEGEGAITEVKRGVQVFPGKDGSLIAVLRPGKGVHIVEYAIGGLAREEVAARLAKLDAEVAALQKTAAAK